MIAVVMAGGCSRRFGSNKLLALFNGKPLFTWVLDAIEEAGVFRVLLVTQYPQIAEYCRAEGLDCVLSESCRLGASCTIKLALNRIMADFPGEPVLFTAADQPFLKASTLKAFAEAYLNSCKGLASFMCQGQPSNPAIFSPGYFAELLALDGDRGGRAVLNAHKEDCLYFEATAEELKDIDYISDLSL